MLDEETARKQFQAVIDAHGCTSCTQFKGVAEEKERIFILCSIKCVIFCHRAGERWFMTLNVISCKNRDTVKLKNSKQTRDGNLELFLGNKG